MAKQDIHIPLIEKLKGIPGIFGVHLNETPKYRVLRRDGEVELREYEPMIIARTWIAGLSEDAKNEGFVKLAGYIFGQNRANETLQMTSPVLMQTESESSTVMSFIMPAKLTGQTVPLPNDSEILLQEIPNETWAVISYSGNNTADEIAEKRNQLESWLILHEFPVENNSFRIAQYDAPNTISQLRRNEVQFRVYRQKAF